MRHVGRARLLVRSDKVQQRRSMAINLAELVFHGAQLFQAVGALVKAAESEAVEAHKAEDEAERAKLENALGMGAKGKGSAKALGGAAASPSSDGSPSLDGDLGGSGQATASIWPHVEERIVDLVEAHRSTIVFANSRGLAERLTSRLNEVHAFRQVQRGLLDPEQTPGRRGSAGAGIREQRMGAGEARAAAASGGASGTASGAASGEAAPDADAAAEMPYAPPAVNHLPCRRRRSGRSEGRAASR